MQEIYTLSFTATNGRARRNSNDVRFSSNLGLSLGCIHFVFGLLSVVLGVVGLIAEFQANKLGSALWCGPVFQAAGAAGVVASRKWYRKSYVRAFCVASLVSALVALLLFALTCVGIANHYEQFGTAGYRINIGDYMAKVSANLVVLSVLETVLSVVSATVAARAIRWRHVPPSQRSKHSVLRIRETFMVANGGEGAGEGQIGSAFGVPVTRMVVPDVVRYAPETLAALHRIASSHQGHLQLRPASQLLDPHFPHDSWDAEYAYNTEFNSNDETSQRQVTSEGNHQPVRIIESTS